MSGYYPTYVGAAYPASGGGLTITELDGSPSSVCTTLVFPTGAVTIAAGVATLIVANSSHVHGNISNGGAIGSTANLPIITTSGGVLTVGTMTGTGTIIVASVSPDLTGDPTATTQAVTDNSTRIATTNFVKTAIPGRFIFKIDTTATGQKYLNYVVPFACTITGWELVGDASGSVVIDLWKDTYANYPPVVGDTITGSAKPTISSGIKAQSSTLTGWTTALAAGDYLEVNVVSRATITNVTLSLAVTRT